MTAGRQFVAFRVDASDEIGTGHVMRCLALAQGVREKGADVAFISREHKGHLLALIEERDFRVYGLAEPREFWRPHGSGPVHARWLGTDWQTDANETIDVLNGRCPDWLVVDHYALDARWEERLKADCGSILVIDDLADRPHACDLLVDQNLIADSHERYKERVSDNTTLMLGPDYALLRPEYLSLRDQIEPRKGPVRRILVSFGGVDRYGLTRSTIDKLLAMNGYDFEVDVVLVATSPDYAALARAVAGRENFRLHARVPSLAPLMAAADLMIGACGTTSWERLCLGLPAIVVTVADNQHPIAKELNRRGLVQWIGDARTDRPEDIRARLTDVLRQVDISEWSMRCMAVVDGLGVARVSTALG